MQPMHREMPTVWLLGDVAHREFAEAVSLIRTTSRATCIEDVGRAAELVAGAPVAPELFVLAASRTGVIATPEIERLRRAAPLAGVVALLGSWCEGESRSGRPAAGVGRVYWYDFPNWWRRQMSAWAAGCCPEWARAEDFGLPAPAGKLLADCDFARAGSSSTPAGLVALETTCYETAAALTDVLRFAGFATAGSTSGSKTPPIRGASVGIWEGRQLDNRELPRLAAFCAKLAVDHAPVVALADFPRRDRVELSLQAGAAAVLGKPWRNADLIATLHQAMDNRDQTTAVRVARAA